MKHFVNSANVGIKFRTGVPFFAENHCRVNQLFNIYSVLDSQYIVCFREKAFHTYCLTGSEQRFFTIGYVGFFYGKIPCLFLLFKITNGRTQLLFAVFYPLITLAFSLLQLYKYDRISIKQAAVAAVVHTPVRPAQFNAMVNRYEIHLYLRIIIHRRNSNPDPVFLQYMLFQQQEPAGRIYRICVCLMMIYVVSGRSQS